LSEEFTIRAFGNDQALVKERRDHIVCCSTYAKEQIYTILRATRADNNTGVADTQGKELSK
jgi:hypothetical protein